LRLNISSKYLPNYDSEKEEDEKDYDSKDKDYEEKPMMFLANQEGRENWVRHETIKRALTSEAYFKQPLDEDDSPILKETNLMVNLTDSTATASMLPFVFEIPSDEEDISISINNDKSHYNTTALDLEKIKIEIDGVYGYGYAVNRTSLNENNPIDLITELKTNEEITLFETDSEKIIIRIDQGVHSSGMCIDKTSLPKDVENDELFSFDDLFEWCKPIHKETTAKRV